MIYLEIGTNDLHSISPLVLASEVDSRIDNFRCPTLVGQVLHREGLDLGDFNGNVDLFNSILKTILEARQDCSKLWEHPGLQRRPYYMMASTPMSGGCTSTIGVSGVPSCMLEESFLTPDTWFSGTYEAG